MNTETALRDALQDVCERLSSELARNNPADPHEDYSDQCPELKQAREALLASPPGTCCRCYDEGPVIPANCIENPESLKGAPIGQYHCPDCGAMVMAGLPHPPHCLRCSRRTHPEFDAVTEPPVQPGRVAVPLPYFPDFDLDEPMEYTQLRDEYMALCLFLRSNYRPDITIPAETRQAPSNNALEDECPKCGADYQDTKCGERVFACGSLDHPNAGLTRGAECLRRESTAEFNMPQFLCDLCQLLNGWSQDGSPWSEFDESVRQRALKLQVTPPVPAAQRLYRLTLPEGTVDPGALLHVNVYIPIVPRPQDGSPFVGRRVNATLTPVPSRESEQERCDEALREICIMCGGFDPADGEGTSPERIVEIVRKFTKAPPPVPRDERADFEKWWASCQWDLKRDKLVAFDAWQARAGGAV